MTPSSSIHQSFLLDGLKGSTQVDDHKRKIPSWVAPEAQESFPNGDSCALRMDHDAYRFFHHARLLPARRSQGEAQSKRHRQPSDEMIPAWQYPEKPHPLWGQFPIFRLLGSDDEVASAIVNRRGPFLNNPTHKPPPVQPRIFFSWLQSPRALRDAHVKLEPVHFDFSNHKVEDPQRYSTFQRAGLLQGLVALLIEDAKRVLGPGRHAHFYARRESANHHAMVWAGDTHHYFKKCPSNSPPARAMPSEVAGLLFRRLPALPACGNAPAACSPEVSWGKFPESDPQWRCLVATARDLKHVSPSLSRFNFTVVLNENGTLELRDKAGLLCPLNAESHFQAPFAVLRARLALSLLQDLQKFFS